MRAFLHSLAAVLLTSLLAQCAAPDGSPATQLKQDEQALRHLKTVEWPRAYREQDTVLLKRILADEFRGIDAQGSWSSKPEELAYIRQHRTTHTFFQYTIRRLQVFEGQTALVAGYGTARGLNAEGPYAYTYQSSNFLVKRQGRWQAVASHVSGVRKLALSDASYRPARYAVQATRPARLAYGSVQQ